MMSRDPTHYSTEIDPRAPRGWLIAFSRNGTFHAKNGERAVIGVARNLDEVYEAIENYDATPAHPGWHPNMREIL